MASSSPLQSTLHLDHHDESVRIAIHALGDMRNGGPHPAFQSSPTAASTSTSPLSDEVDAPDFVYRVSQLPIVTSALRVYSQGKASSRVVKYGAEMMESSIQTMARPVIDRLPNVNQLDEFACRQLDRLGRYRKSSESDHTHEDAPTDDRSHTLSRSAPTHDSPMSRERDDSANVRGGRRVPIWLEANSPFVPAPPPPPESRTPTPHPPETSSSLRNCDQSDSSSRHDVTNDQQLAHRSSWQTVLLEAGGFSAALSEESMRRLKYCLHWLQYATAHIDAQILILRDFTATLQPLPSLSSSSSARTHSDPISPAHMRTLTDVRRDVVNTIRQVVDVISKYAGGALPEPARTRVRGFILKLPQRWASAANANSSNTAISSTTSVGAAATSADSRKRGRYQHHRERSSSLTVASSAGTESSGSSRAASPMASPRLTRSSLAANSHHTVPPTAGAAVQAAQRILTLATESLDMMRGVTGVVKDSLDRADAWVGRLRVVGLQRGANEADEDQRATHDSGLQPTAGGEARAFSQQDRPKHEGEEDGDTFHMRTHSYSSSTISSMSSSVPSTPYSVPGTPAPGPTDGPSPSVVTGIAGLTLGMAARNGELGFDIRKQVEQRKGREEEVDMTRMEVDE